MIVQLVLTALLGGLILYAVKEGRKAPVIAALSAVAAAGGLYLTWVPTYATELARWAGVGRGTDLILYVWAAISLIVMLNLHLKLRSQMEVITALARALALMSHQKRNVPPSRRHAPPIRTGAPKDKAKAKAA